VDFNKNDIIGKIKNAAIMAAKKIKKKLSKKSDPRKRGEIYRNLSYSNQFEKV